MGEGPVPELFIMFIARACVGLVCYKGGGWHCFY